MCKQAATVTALTSVFLPGRCGRCQQAEGFIADGGNVSVSAGTAGSGDLNIIGSRIAATDRVAADLNIDAGGGLIVSAGRNVMETDTSKSIRSPVEGK